MVLFSYNGVGVFLLCLQLRQIFSFVASTTTVSRRRKYRTPIILHAAASVSSTQEKSAELLRLLRDKAANYSKNEATADGQINSLMQTLIASKSKFDPSKCIDGPLYASVHFTGGSTPLWEKIAVKNVRNVKGQRYTLKGGTSGTFVNYAEVLGRNFYLKAVGDCIDEGPVRSLQPEEDAASSDETSNPFGAFKSLFQSVGGGNQQSTLLPTPYDYSAKVKGASFVFFQKYSLDLNIEGTGTVRVLYADQTLRILLSPTDTNVTLGAGDWESEGLIVVQVRVDLVYDDWDTVL